MMKFNLIFVIFEKKDVYMKEEWNHIYKDLEMNGYKKEIMLNLFHISIRLRI
jgi:hypothetical protein